MNLLEDKIDALDPRSSSDTHAERQTGETREAGAEIIAAAMSELIQSTLSARVPCPEYIVGQDPGSLHFGASVGVICCARYKYQGQYDSVAP